MLGPSAGRYIAAELPRGGTGNGADADWPPSYIEDLQLSRASASQLKIAPGKARDAADTTNLASPVSLSLDITVAGAGGLDAGVEAILTWYYVYLIFDPSTTTYAGLISASAVAPTLPPGYTVFRRVGSVFNDLAGDFLDFAVIGSDRRRNYYYLSDFPALRVLANGTAVIYTPVALATVIPPNSQVATLRATNNNAGVDAYLKWVGLPLTLGAQYVGPTRSDWVADFYVPNQRFEYRFAAPPGGIGLDVDVLGFMEEL